MYEDLIVITDTSVVLPSDREVQRLHRMLKIPSPIPTPEHWELFLLRALRNRANRVVERAEPSTPQPATEELSPVALLEARIRQMPSSEVRRVAAELALSYEPHPTNPGLTAMRARNALYAAVRRGVTF